MTAREHVLGAIEAVTGERPSDDAPLPGDSLARVQIGMEVELALGLDMRAAEATAQTVGELVAMVERMVRR